MSSSVLYFRIICMKRQAVLLCWKIMIHSTFDDGVITQPSMNGLNYWPVSARHWRYLCLERTVSRYHSTMPAGWFPMTSGRPRLISGRATWKGTERREMPLSPPNQTNLIRRYYANGKPADGSKERNYVVTQMYICNKRCEVGMQHRVLAMPNLGIAGVQRYRLG